MSAYVVETVHIDALLTAGLTWRNYGPLRWFAPESEEPRGAEDFQSGEPWGPTAIETANRRRRELTTETADQVGFMLVAQNYASVNYRYEDKADPIIYRFRHLPGHPDPLIILKALDCYEYQACETPDYEETEAHAFCQSLRKLAIHKLPGYDAAPWGIDDARIFMPKAPAPKPEPPAPKAEPVYLSTTDRAKAIRDTLKKQYGWTSRQVSVRADYFSMGSSIDVTIKDPAVSLAKVKAVANAHEDISRDASGEILSGGNRYIHVNYDADALTARSAKYIQAIEEASLQVSGNALAKIAGTPYLLGRNDVGHWSLWGTSHLCACYDFEEMARQIACRLEQE